MTTPTTYGIAYTPATTQLPIVGDLAQLAVTHGTRYVRLQWTDLTNITRCRIIPIGAFKALLASARPGVGITHAALGLVGAGCAPGFSGTGEYLYTPDLLSLRPCGYAPGHASVMGWFEEKSPNGDGKYDVALCPRSQLKKVVEDARAAGVEFLVGIETEFILLKSTDPIEGVNEYPWSTTAAIPSGSDVAKCLEEIADALQTSGIEVLMYHAEAAPGQYEFVTGPLPPLEAADAVILTRETIFNISSKYGFRATLAPRVFPHDCGSAAHAHISIHRTDAPPTNPPRASPDTNKSTTMNPLERSFLQALLTHMPALAAITLPTQASYSRVQDGIWSGGTYTAWGTENRETIVRLTGAPGSHHFEVRTHDGTANPYLALAGLLGAGLYGVREGAELTVMEVEGMAADLSEQERKKRGVVGRMPRSLAQAREAMRQSEAVKSLFGGEFVEKYLAVNETMESHLKADAPELEMTKLVLTY
ncbi:glutamine synthetase/guanido kinase [Amylostereum chailletii]|nr:glutamine synthetase/guanido kinase [Amylostereum chailletii]